MLSSRGAELSRLATASPFRPGFTCDQALWRESAPGATVSKAEPTSSPDSVLIHCVRVAGRHAPVAGCRADADRSSTGGLELTCCSSSAWRDHCPSERD